MADYGYANIGKLANFANNTIGGLTANDIMRFPRADVQPVDRWISIEESKPEDMQQVLAVVDGDVREAFYNTGCFIGSNFYRSINEVKW